MQGRGNARFPCTPSPKPTSTTNKNRLAARTGKKLGCGNDARWNPWKSPTPTFPPLPPHLEIPQQTRDSHIPTATTTTGYRGLDQHQTKINTKANTNNKTKVVYTDNLTHPTAKKSSASPRRWWRPWEIADWIRVVPPRPWSKPLWSCSGPACPASTLWPKSPLRASGNNGCTNRWPAPTPWAESMPHSTPTNWGKASSWSINS